jgi:hypothetical protein
VVDGDGGGRRVVVGVEVVVWSMWRGSDVGGVERRKREKARRA